MGVSVLDVDSAVTGVLITLGIDDVSVGPDSPEVVSESIRRLASHRAPITRRALQRAVVEALTPLCDSRDELVELTRAQLDLLFTNGDLIEAVTEDGVRRGTSVILGPPAFVEHNELFLLLGTRPDGVPLIGGVASGTVELRGNLRAIRSMDPESTREELRDLGLTEIPLDTWLESPALASAESVTAATWSRLRAVQVSGGIEGMELIDPSSSTHYYRGRWRQPQKGDNGLMVGRRPRQFGADKWCACELKDGLVIRFLDLPTIQGVDHARDEAWLLQLALDSEGGNPQSFVRRRVDSGRYRLDFFGPLPSWAQRRLAVFGDSVSRSKAALFSVEFDVATGEEVSDYLIGHLWMTMNETSGAK